MSDEARAATTAHLEEYWSGRPAMSLRRHIQRDHKYGRYNPDKLAIGEGELHERLHRTAAP